MNVYESILKEANRRRALMPKRELCTPVRLEDLPKGELEYLEREKNDRNSHIDASN